MAEERKAALKGVENVRISELVDVLEQAGLGDETNLPAEGTIADLRQTLEDRHAVARRRLDSLGFDSVSRIKVTIECEPTIEDGKLHPHCKIIIKF
jgi:hypothetical protein